jgi:hypothetical protein
LKETNSQKKARLSMEQNKQKRKSQNRDDEQIINAVRAGASTHMLARQFKLTIEEASDYIESVAAETKEGGIAHRIMLRSLLRDQTPTAVRVINEMMTGVKRDQETGRIVNILETKLDIEKANLRLKAADTILKHAARFIDEDVVRGFIEQPAPSGLQETLFDFESEIRDDGSTVLTAKPALRLALPLVEE